MLLFKPKFLVVIICGLCLFHLFPPVNSIFKMVKKKKFMEGFLVGFLIGNEYAAHKAPPKPPMPLYPAMSGMHGMSGYGKMHDYESEGGIGHLGEHSFSPYKKSDRAESSFRSYRIRPPYRKWKKRSRSKKLLKLPIYVRKNATN